MKSSLKTLNSSLVFVRAWIAYSLLLCAVPTLAGAMPTLQRPQTGDVLPMTAVGQQNPVYEFIFQPVVGAAHYRVTFDDGSPVTPVVVDVFDFLVGEVGVAAVVLPPTTHPGTYKTWVQAMDSSGLPMGLPSPQVLVDLVVQTPMPFVASGTLMQINGGDLLVSSVDIPIGTTVMFDSDLTVYSLGPVHIAGRILALPPSGLVGPGVSLRILARDTIEISGHAHAGWGSYGRGQNLIGVDPAVATEAITGDGSRGGDLSILSSDGDILLTGSGPGLLAAGRGGSGGSALARAADGAQPGEAGGLARAVTGDGGAGGDLTLFAPGGHLVVPTIASLIFLGGGGEGGYAQAVGGDGASAGSGGLPGLGGSVEVVVGDGGSAGLLNIETIDWDGDRQVTSAELSVMITGFGGPGGSSLAVVGRPGSSTSAGSCATALGPTPPTAMVFGGRGGDSWIAPGRGSSTRITGLEGVGSGSGGDAVAVAGDGGDVVRIGLPPGVRIPRDVIAGRGGFADARGGQGGPHGESGGTAQAFGGQGGQALVTTGGRFADQIGGPGGNANAFGGAGQTPFSCCGSPSAPGLPGGYGGDASAIAGNGGAATEHGGDGGGIIVIGGSGGDGGDGCPAGVGGPAGQIRFVVGTGGAGNVSNGANGPITQAFQNPAGLPGQACCP